MTNVAAYGDLCPGCFAGKGTASICPHCGYDESLKRGPLVLAHRTLLNHGQYLIGRVLGKPGGFGITYLALDTKLETRVAIKEYLPRDLAGRDASHATVAAHSNEDQEFFRYGLTQFLQEARTLAQFDHANIVRVRNFFEENGTGYLVMDYYDGVTLADYLALQPQGKLPEKTAVAILMPILDGLREVHAKNFLHRDIKPQNIYLTTGNRPILLDFGAARQAMSERSRSLSVVLSEGYAPYEQYHRRGEQGPWTDIYGCAAVLYHAIAGEAPPSATERGHKDELDIAGLGVSASLANALRLGLAADHRNRPQRMMEFQALLLGDGEAEAGKAEAQRHVPVQARIVEPSPVTQTKGKSPFGQKVGWTEPVEAPPPRHWPWAIGIILLLLLGAGQLIYLYRVELAVLAPELRAPLTATCEMLGCDVPYPHRPGLMAIESSDLAPADNERLHLTATLRNRAPFAQAYPHLELTLTDSADAPMLRKILAPADYLPVGKAATFFAARDEVVVSLHLETPGLSAVGYRLYLFYPSDETERMQRQISPDSIKLFPAAFDVEIRPSRKGATLAPTSSRSGATDDYAEYVNSRFGFSIRYPSKLFAPQGESENGDGQIFISQDSETKLTVYGSHILLGGALKDNYERELQANPNRQITYKILRNNWYVIAGTDGGLNFYQKTVQVREGYATLDFSYPIKHRGAWDKVLMEISKGFKSIQ